MLILSEVTLSKTSIQGVIINIENHVTTSKLAELNEAVLTSDDFAHLGDLLGENLVHLK